MNSEMLNALKQGNITIDDLTVHEKHISEVDPKSFKVETMPSGFPSLDDYKFLKKDRSELVIIGARPSMGKSAFMFQLAYNVSVESPVHIFSLEMDKESIVGRLVSSHLNRSMNSIQDGRITDEELIRGHSELSKLHYYIDDRGGLNVDDICEAAIQANIRHNTKLIVIDYLQLIKGRGEGNRQQEIGEITRSLRALAKELRTPIIVGAQLNRANEVRGTQSGDFRPILSDLRESGDIEQDADIVMLLHRQSRYDKTRAGEVDLIIAKNRNGAVGEITMNFTEQQTKFIDLKPVGGF